MKRLITILSAFLAAACLHAQNLYVGANFHPHDYDSEEEIDSQISLMRQAGFNVVRMGHLAWDSFEPSDGDFEFEWFDRVMDKMHQAGIRVILDIPVRPAPMWVHRASPGTTIVTFQGDTLQPLHRYFNDVGDPGYQHYAFRLSEKMAERYGSHPALMAFGIDNELGDGSISYSENVRQRFILWLKEKYGTVQALNKAWAGWRWSRRLTELDEVVLPDLDNAGYGGNAERQLDFRRFISDETLGFYTRMIKTVNSRAPGKPTFTNAWYYSTKFFDYAPLSYSGLMTHGGCGFYPGTALDTYYGMRGAAFGMARIQFEQTTPHWCAEFTTMAAAPQAIRKQAYMTLMYGNQMVCGWTWQSMWAGEEQYLEGMVDWDGVPNYKYDEYKQIAAEFKKLEPYLPYQPDCEVGIALDFSSTAMGRMNGYPVTPHENQVQACFDWFFDRNMDVRIIDPALSTLDYKLIIIPGMTHIPEATADKLRAYVAAGGTLVMSSRSGMTDAGGQIVRDTQPAGLADVFGIRVGGVLDLPGGSKLDEIQPRGAEVLLTDDFFGKTTPIVTRHSYGNGQAIYVGVAADKAPMAKVISDAVTGAGVRRGPDVPARVSARWTDSRHILLLNHSDEDKTINISGRSILTGRKYDGQYILKANDADFIEVE